MGGLHLCLSLTRGTAGVCGVYQIHGFPLFPECLFDITHLLGWMARSFAGMPCDGGCSRARVWVQWRLRFAFFLFFLFLRCMTFTGYSSAPSVTYCKIIVLFSVVDYFIGVISELKVLGRVFLFLLSVY